MVIGGVFLAHLPKWVVQLAATLNMVALEIGRVQVKSSAVPLQLLVIGVVQMHGSATILITILSMLSQGSKDNLLLQRCAKVKYFGSDG